MELRLFYTYGFDQVHTRILCKLCLFSPLLRTVTQANRRVVTVLQDADAPAPSISSEQSGSKSAFDVMMNSSANGKGGNSVRVSEKLPLILQVCIPSSFCNRNNTADPDRGMQHAGHSRTIVGYEVNAQGNVNVLMFDPGRWVMFTRTSAND